MIIHHDLSFIYKFFYLCSITCIRIMFQLRASPTLYYTPNQITIGMPSTEKSTLDRSPLGETTAETPRCPRDSATAGCVQVAAHPAKSSSALRGFWEEPREPVFLTLRDKKKRCTGYYTRKVASPSLLPRIGKYRRTAG